MENNPQQWFRFDIPLFDKWVPKLSPESGILFCVMVRKMSAWDKTTDTISTSQLIAASGMKERRVQRAMEALLTSGAPVKKIGRSKDGATYSLDPSRSVASDGIAPPAPESRSVASDGIAPADPCVPSPVTERSVASDGMEPVPSPVTPTTDTLQSINRTDGSSVSVSAPVSLGGSPSDRDNPAREESDVPVASPILHQGEGLVVGDELPNTIPHTSQIDQPTSVSVVNHQGLGLEAQPNSKQKQNHSVVSKRTGKRYELGVDDADYVADILQIRLIDAKGIMHDCPGANGYQMLCVILDDKDEKSKERVMNANNRAAYVRSIVRANVARILAQARFPGGSKANQPATATEQTSPHTRAPLPFAEQAPARTADTVVRDAIHAIGNGKHTVEEIGEQIAKELGKYNKLKLQTRLASMIKRGLVSFTQGCDGVTHYASLEAPGKPVAPALDLQDELQDTKPIVDPVEPAVIFMDDAEPVTAPEPFDLDAALAAELADRYAYVQKDMATMRAEQDQAQQAERNARYAANSAELDRQMAQELAVAVEVPVAPSPAPQAILEPPACATLPEKIVWHIQHQPGGHDLLSLVAATGRNYDAVSHAVMGLVNGKVIRKESGRWWMAERATEPTKEAA